ncbi:MAG: DNA polymerase IV [Parcubacteria group bacterium]|nr:DNA polymerase IV [Parcubacteria group bacterium]
MERIIGHIDMDAFFASVEERDKPYLKGLPVIVGADPENGNGRGVVSTANYEARKLGIHSALPITKAWEYCEASRSSGGLRCVFIPSGFSRYKIASCDVFAHVRTFVRTLSQTSIDEAYLDLGFCGSFVKAEKLAAKIMREVKKKTSLTCSIGIGPNKMIAKIASNYNKPAGLTIVTPERMGAFLAPLSIRAIPGIGKKTENAFVRLGIKTVKDLQECSWEDLQQQFGKREFSIWERVCGVDERTVEAQKAKRKSIGKNHTFNTDTRDINEVLDIIKQQIEVILREMKKQGFNEFRTVVLTVRFSDFMTRTRTLTLDTPIHTAIDFELKATKLVFPFFEKAENPTGKAIRLIGVRAEKLLQDKPH